MHTFTHHHINLLQRSLYNASVSCSSADEGDCNLDPTHKAIREKERRQANNVRERYVLSTLV